MKKINYPVIITFIAVVLLAALFVVACSDSDSIVDPQSNNLFLEEITANYIEAPIPVKWSEKTILAYELQIKNYQGSGFEIYKVEVFSNAVPSRLIKTYEDEDFQNIFSSYDESHMATGSVLYLWPEFESKSEIPDSLYQNIF